MKFTGNPWVDRFRAVDDLDVIRQRTRIRAEPLHLLHQDPAKLATARMHHALSRIFYPTQRSCEIIQSVVQAALGHAQMYHASSHAHLSRAYLDKLDIEPYVPMMLTGLAGTGKTQIRKAIGRLLSEESTIKPDAGHGEMPLVSMRSIAVRSRNRLSSLLLPLANPELANRSARLKVGDLPDACAHWLHMTGVCLVVVDELQFLTQSRSANTFVAQALLAITYLRTPVLVLANYSLGHRLKRRPSEELQRLLGQHMVLLPDPPDSADWQTILREYQRTVPDVFTFDFVKQATSLWAFSAGVKRELVTLLVLAYDLARKKRRTEVSWADVEVAYTTSEYSMSRRDIEALKLYGIGSSALREDLQCPFPIAASEEAAYAQALRKSRSSEVAVQCLDAVLTQRERGALAELKCMNAGRPTRTGSPEGASRRRREELSAATLKEADAEFRKTFQ